ncbi:nonstructural protein [Microviridae sp.]|nr:nonstructural protein [Microviridae sp.]
MKMQIYAVYDVKAKMFTIPWFQHNSEVAVRNFRNACNDPATNFSKNPEDYTLHYLGEFDDEDGLIVQEAAPLSTLLTTGHKEQ